MDRYGASERWEGKERAVVLADRMAGSEAEVAPGIGAQCHRYSWTHRGEKLDILDPAENLAALASRPMYYGNPILFPFPNRVKDGRFTFGGREYTLPINEAERGHALHGLVFNRPWRLVGWGAAETAGAWATCRFESKDFPEVEAVFPFPFAIEYTYRLIDGRLQNEVTVTNAGATPMPAGFGVHPWFRAPLGAPGSRAAVELKAPVSHVWELDDRLIPTGRKLPAAAERDLSRGIRLGAQFFDDVYAGLNDGLGPDGWSEAVVSDPAAGVEVAVRSDRSFRELVIYAPLDRNIVCIEPYTCPTDAFNLEARGIDAGVIVLGPGEAWSGRIDFVPRPITKAPGR